MLQMAFNYPVIVPVQENRKKVEVPIYEKVGLEYFKELNRWFNDSFGFRDYLIRAKNQIDFNLFNLSEKVYIGKNGWLFYRHVVDGQAKLDTYFLKNSEEISKGVENLSALLGKRGIQLIIMIAPMKNVFYGQYLPEGAPKLPKYRGIDKIQENLRSIPGVIFIDINQILRKTQELRPVFHKTDFHWNDPAAFEVSKILVNRLGEVQYLQEPLWKIPLELSYQKNSGGEAMFMPLIFSPTEESLFVKETWINEPRTYVEKIPPFVYIYEQTKPNKNTLSPMVVLGDSFFDGMFRSGIPNYFTKIYRANINEVSLDELLNKIPADTKYFLLEFIEADTRILNELKIVGEK